MAKKPTKKTIQANKAELQQQVQVLSAAVSRANLSAKLGYSYDGERNLYQALGYKNSELTFETDYYPQYVRQDIAKAIIDRPVNTTWRGPVLLLESDDDKDTALENAWIDMEDNLKIKSKFIRADRLAGLGRYAVLLLGLDDVRDNADLALPVAIGGKRKLLYVTPLSEPNAKIQTWETNQTSARYGLPLQYEITISEADGNVSTTVRVHHTRIIHIPSQLLESEIYGMPRLEAVFNRLKDLEKIVGGSAEMFWRGARPGYQGKVDKEFDLTQDVIDGLKDQVDEYENNLRRFLMLEGIELDSLAQQVSDPDKHVQVQLQMISAVTGIPIRILIGSERGELASTQDQNNWYEEIEARRMEFAEPSIIRPFVDRCIEYGILPESKADDGRYSIEWMDLGAQSAEDKATIGKTISEALKNYASSPLIMDIMPPDVFYKYVLGLSADEIELINEFKEQAISEEESDFATEVIIEEEVIPEV